MTSTCKSHVLHFLKPAPVRKLFWFKASDLREQRLFGTYSCNEQFKLQHSYIYSSLCCKAWVLILGYRIYIFKRNKLLKVKYIYYSIYCSFFFKAYVSVLRYIMCLTDRELDVNVILSSLPFCAVFTFTYLIFLVSLTK